MKIDKKELIDFFLWFRENGETYINESIEDMIDIYLKSFNSQASEETPSVNDNKDKKKVCYHPSKALEWISNNSVKCLNCGDTFEQT